MARSVFAFLLVLFGAFASGGSSQSPAPATAPPAILPENRGFDGGTSAIGGFTNAASSVRDSVISSPRGAVWAVLPAVFETLGIETPTVDPRSFLIGNPGSRVARISGSTRLSNYLDCGTGILGPNADNYEVTLGLMVQLATTPDGGTLVRTTLNAFSRPRASAGQSIQCASQRTLERQVVGYIAAELSGAGSSRSTGARAVRGRVPTTGDRLRVECLMPQAQGRLVGEGLFVGAADGNLLLDAGTGSVAVPAAQVGRVQVHERRSMARIGGFVGVVLGIAAGAYEGRSWYDPDTKANHYPSGVFMVGGALAGGVAGLLLGRITGSFIDTDAWMDAPDGWASRYSASADASIVTAPEAGACPSFEADG
jgi:hypothetical protein